jgi:two-component system response regulator QseB
MTVKERPPLMPKILLVEDDVDLSYVVRSQLEHEGMLVDVAFDGTEASSMLRIVPYDLVVLDWMLPGVTGIDICKQYRARNGKAPILMLTAMGTITDKAAGLDAGADDYLVKPFHPTELSARVRALLRRPPNMSQPSIKVRNLELYPDLNLVVKDGKEIDLTAKELGILSLLMRHPNRFFTADAIFSRVWKSESVTSPETIRTHLKLLRRKLEDTDDNDPLIKNIRGLGYKISE